MHESFEIKSSSGNYIVQLGQGLLEKVKRDYPDAIYLIDACLSGVLHLENQKVIPISVSEEAKSLERMAEVIVSLKKHGANRDSHVVALGGGVIQDIATFVASIYMRGISWTYMPTTLLGMMDSCIGGKSSINVGGYKNLVGNFYPPEAILVDPLFASTLNSEQIVGGLFEAVKICYARSEDALDAYLDEKPSLHIAPTKILSIVSLTLKTKKWFIEIDEFDRKERLLLNYGHTFGHAIEAGTDFGLSHGIAVGVGMMIAVEFARSNNLLNSQGEIRTKKLMSHIRDMLGLLNSVELQPPELKLERILLKFEMDKKHQAECYRLVCPQGEGGLGLIARPKNESTRSEIRDAYRAVFKDLSWNYV